ncbi:hypothetical protein [uncultured Mycobacterium sp.]|uniref:hypothetical protein n=1 Tax=uncultured Mycobacterium sp. TaxID=171292 RepID=UPI0035CAFECD
MRLEQVVIAAISRLLANPNAWMEAHAFQPLYRIIAGTEPTRYAYQAGEFGTLEVEVDVPNTECHTDVVNREP